MTVIELVKERLSLPSDAALARLCRVNRSCVWEWRDRLAGGIPSRHHSDLYDEAKARGVELSYDELRGK